MKEIKFRAKSSFQDTWYYGSSLLTKLDQGGDYDLTLSLFWTQIEKGSLDTDTLGEYTGRKDRNLKEIYEGATVRPISKYSYPRWEVYWDEQTCQFRLCANKDKQFDKTHPMDWADEVIDNIDETPGQVKERR